jgi:hypothetical protein
MNYKRIGDELLIWGSFTTGTTTADLAYITLPTGLSIDHTKLNTNNNSVVGRAYRNSNANNNDYTVFVTNGQDRLYFGYTDSSTSGDQPLSGENGSTLWGNSEVAVFEGVRVPIAEWSGNSTNILNSTQQDFQKVIARAYVSGSSANIAIANSSFEVVDFDTVVEDKTGSITTGSGWKFTAPSNGVYKFSYTPFWSSASNLDLTAIEYVRKNSGGSTLQTKRALNTDLTTQYPGNAEASLYMDKGDYVEVQILQVDSTTSSRNLDTGVSHELIVTKEHDKTIIGNAGVPFELQTNTSSVKTPSASGHWHSHTNNSITLTPGTWELKPSECQFYASGTPSFTRIFAVWSESNGSDSASSPTALGTASTYSIISGDGSGVEGTDMAVSGNNFRITTPSIFLTVTSTTTFYLNTFATMSTASAARIKVHPVAERKR